MLNLKPGQKIVVFNEQREELGEGTFLKQTKHLDMVAYECREHTILARGTHYVRCEGQMHCVPARGLGQSGLA